MAALASPALRTVLVAQRKRRLGHAAMAGAVALLAAWSLHSVVLADTDWSRIGGSLGFLGALGRFLSLDLALAPQLVEPAIETFMMATLGTLLGCVFSLPVAWLGALNVTPSRYVAYPIARFLMVLSRSGTTPSRAR